MLEWVFRGVALPTNLYVALATEATSPTPATNTLGDLTEITANGTGGYQSGGFQLTRNTTDFDTISEDDSQNRALVQIKDVSWSHSSETIPASGSGARYAVLTDDNATVDNREVIAYWDLINDRSVAAPDTLTLQDLTLRLEEIF